MVEQKPYTLADLEDAPVDDIWGSNSTRIVVTKECVAATINDNARLRALIKAAEKIDGVASAGHCPWCGWFVGAPLTFHGPDCKAFTPAGDVK